MAAVKTEIKMFFSSEIIEESSEHLIDFVNLTHRQAR